MARIAPVWSVLPRTVRSMESLVFMVGPCCRWSGVIARTGLGAKGLVMRVAALTMMYNEPVWASVWARHYAREVGAENCFVLDHGSTDGSTAGLGVGVERLSRSTLDEDARAALISDRVAGLLRRYDAVVHSDADELLVAEPGRFADVRQTV